MPPDVISPFAVNVAIRNLAAPNAAAKMSLANLSIGTWVVSTKETAASLAIRFHLETERTGPQQALIKAGQPVSRPQIADGAIAKVNDILTPMNALTVKAGSGQLSGTERSMLDTQYQALRSEIDRIADDMEFGGTLLTGVAMLSQSNHAPNNLHRLFR